MGEDAGTWLSLRGKKHQINFEFHVSQLNSPKSVVFLDFREKKKIV